MTELQTLRDDLNQTISALTETARRLKTSARNAVNCAADYEKLKADYKIQLEAEDKLSKTKRTVSLIEAMYRSKFADERLAAQMAKVEYESDKDLFKGIMAKLNALQTIARLQESEMKLGENFQ